MKTIIIATIAAMALNSANALAQGSPDSSSNARGDSANTTHDTNGASNTANCMPGNGMSAQRSNTNSAMNNNRSNNAMGSSANCNTNTASTRNGTATSGASTTTKGPTR